MSRSASKTRPVRLGPKERLLRLVDGSPLKRAQLFAAIVAGFVALSYVICRISGEDLRQRDYWNLSYLGGFYLPWHLGVLAIWAALAALAAFDRRRRKESRLLLHAFAQFGCLSSLIFVYSAGMLSSPYLLAMAAVFSLTLLLFENRVALPAVASGLAATALAMAAEGARWLPSAPLMLKPVLDGSVVLPSWLLWNAPLAFTMIVVNCLVLASSMSVLRSREKLLAELATHDRLTGVLNHAALIAALDGEIRRTERYGGTVSFVMVDIDHFKRVNDTHGHPAGDRVLATLAKLLHGLMRAQDTVGRYGGEEFGLILPETDSEGARRVAERCREAVASASFLWMGERTLRITASFGCATYESGRPSKTAGIVARADAALYEAKRTGRNRVCLRSGRSKAA